MSDQGLHRVADDLRESWVDDWARAGVNELESFLSEHAAGLADWLTITRGTELWKTATAHMIAMVTATVCFGLAALTGHGEWKEGNVYGFPLVMTLVGFAVLTLGGWLGGAIVFTHGMRVLN